MALTTSPATAPVRAPVASAPAFGLSDPATALKMLAAVRSGMMLLDATSVLWVNPTAAAMFSRTPGALAGQSMLDLVAPAHRHTVAEELRRRLTGEPGRPHDIRCVRHSGTEFDVRIWGQAVVLDGRSVNLVTLTDVSELKDALRGAEHQVDLLAQSELLCRSGSLSVDMATGAVQVSAGLRALVGAPDDQPARTSADALRWLVPEDRIRVVRRWRSAGVGEPFEFQHRLQCADGRQLVVLQRGVIHRPELEGGPSVGLAIVMDITARHDAEQRIHELANFDEITGLSNRTHLLLQLDAALHAARREGRGLDLLSVQVPKIAELASTMGYGAADALCMAVAARLNLAGPDSAAMAHLGGGEFALVHRPAAAAGAGDGRQLALALMTALQAPVQLGGADIVPQCRIGLARFPGDGETAQQLLEAAQAARLDAGAAGGLACFEPASNARARRELQVETALRHALERSELSLVYQPQVCLQTGAIIGAEALLRWQCAELGAIDPSEFIPVAERTGQIAAIGEWVIRETCAQTVRWREAGLPPVRVGVNVSPVQFQLCDLAATVERALRDTGASVATLGIEITEGALLHDTEHVAATLRHLQASGVEISLDDFGIGFSSLSRLRYLPIDLLKIDRCFVSDVTAAPDSASITRSIINLAHGLRIPVLAEGVETEGQINMLVANGCDRIQGSFFSPPVPADEMAAMLAGDRRLPPNLTPRRPGARTLMLVDDEASVLSALKRAFRRDGYTIVTAASGAEALEVLALTQVDVIVSDQRMPGMTGVDFLRRVKALHPHTIRMTLSGFTDLQSIIDAVNEGAVYKFLMKPWDDERLREHVAQAFAVKDMADDNRRLQREVAGANADLAALNQRLEELLQRQCEQSQLMQASASGARDLVDALPAAVFGIGPDGMLTYLNQSASDLMPAALGWLGDAPGAELLPLLDALRDPATAPAVDGLSVVIDRRCHRAWLRPLGAAHECRGDVLVLIPQVAVEAL